jgi:hypothetical protein
MPAPAKGPEPKGPPTGSPDPIWPDGMPWTDPGGIAPASTWARTDIPGRRVAKGGGGAIAAVVVADGSVPDWAGTPEPPKAAGTGARPGRAVEGGAVEGRPVEGRGVVFATVALGSGIPEIAVGAPVVGCSAAVGESWTTACAGGRPGGN